MTTMFVAYLEDQMELSLDVLSSAKGCVSYHCYLVSCTEACQLASLTSLPDLL